MPTYQYACTACGEQLEAVQSFSDPSLTECPACSGTLRKVFSAVGVVFKGSGFYKTDSRASSSATDKPAAAKSDSTSGSTSGSKGDGGGKSDTSSKGESSSAKPAATTSSSSTSSSSPAA